MYEYRAVIDITGVDFEALNKMGLENVGKIMRRHYEATFVNEYNHFTDLANPKYEQFNAEWKEAEALTTMTYEQFIKGRLLDLIRNDKWFSECRRVGLFEYEIDDQCQFILVMPDHGVRMRCHLEKI